MADCRQRAVYTERKIGACECIERQFSNWIEISDSLCSNYVSVNQNIYGCRKSWKHFNSHVNCKCCTHTHTRSWGRNIGRQFNSFLISLATSLATFWLLLCGSLIGGFKLWPARWFPTTKCALRECRVPSGDAAVQSRLNTFTLFCQTGCLANCRHFWQQQQLWMHACYFLLYFTYFSSTTFCFCFCFSWQPPTFDN